MSRYYYDLRCYVCGRFVKPDGDLDVPWGSASSTEPPPERRYCPICAKKEKAYHIKHGWVPTRYVQSQWQIEAALELERRRDDDPRYHSESDAMIGAKTAKEIEKGKPERIYADYEIEAAECWMDGQRGFCPKTGGCE